VRLTHASRFGPLRLIGLGLVVVLVVIAALPRAHGAVGAASDVVSPVAGAVTLRKIGQVAGIPTALAEQPSTRRLWVATKSGTIFTLTAGPTGRVRTGRVALDLRRLVGDFGDQGLLDISFSPRGADLFVLYTDPRQVLNLVSFRVSGAHIIGRDRPVLAVRVPGIDHQGGGMAWGPDGALFLGIGDGGRRRQAQSMHSLLGKIIRIEPKQAGPEPYAIPADNPFAGSPFARGEIWASGLRNPWRIARDGDTGSLWVADVGDSQVEEVDVLGPRAGGANLGWPLYEGTRTGPVFAAGAVPEDGWSADLGDAPSDRDGYTWPSYQFSHQAGTCAIVGGLVYRGTQLPGLRGSYLFADVCDDGVRVARPDARSHRFERLIAHLGSTPYSFAEGSRHEVYVVLSSGSIGQIVARR